MDMLDRYLAEVERNLPRDHAPDIIDEIGDDIRSQIDEREAALARPLTEDEQADILRAYGNPKVVASRYAKQQYLIGPQLLPFYWNGVRLALAIVLGLEILVGSIASLATGQLSPLFVALDAAWHSVIYIFGIVTIIFILIERFGGRSMAERLDRWNPRTLPAPSAAPPVSRVGAGFEFVSNIIVLLIAAGVLRGGLERFVIYPFMLTEAGGRSSSRRLFRRASSHSAHSSSTFARRSATHNLLRAFSATLRYWRASDSRFAPEFPS